MESKERYREKFYYLFYKRPEGENVELDNLESVSYTHLDVYKRQSFRSCGIF